MKNLSDPMRGFPEFTLHLIRNYFSNFLTRGKFGIEDILLRKGPENPVRSSGLFVIAGFVIPYYT